LLCTSKIKLWIGKNMNLISSTAWLTELPIEQESPRVAG